VSTYREIVGKKIKKVSADPSSGVAEMWYNTTTGTLRGLAILEAWASTSPLLAAKYYGAGFGTSTAAVYAGGEGTTILNTTNEYNGSGWSSGGTLNTARWEMGGTTAGVETAGLAFGGNLGPPGLSNATEEYNGTAWTSGNNMATTVSSQAGSGIQTAAFSAGGRTPSNTNNSQEYDGTNWSNGNNINTTRQALVGMGTQAAGIIAGGEAPGGGSNSSETYDGTNWTAAPNLGTARYRLSGSGAVDTACLIFGGRFNPPAADKAQTEAFNGTSWSEKGDLATARQYNTGNRGSSSSALGAGGYITAGSSGATSNVEEFTSSTNVITGGAWASGGNMNTARYNMQSSPNAPADAGLSAGGITGTPSATQQSLVVEEYDGSSWTNVTGMPVTMSAGGGAGTQSAYISMGGYSNPPLALSANTFNYNGSSWTALTAIPTATGNRGVGCGTSTAALLIGGKTPAAPGGVSATFEYNSPSWTSGGAMSNIRWQCGSAGVQTAALAIGGATSTPIESTSEEYDGSSWTTGGTLIQGKRYFGSNGAQTDALAYGTEPGSSTNTQGYDGTAWSTKPALATARAAQGSGGGNTGSSALTFGGTPSGGSPVITTTEEFTGQTETANVKTFSTS